MLVGAQGVGGRAGGRSGWDALLGAVRPRGGRRGHGGLFERHDVAVVSDHDSGAFGCQGVAGDHRAGLRGDVHVWRTEPQADPHLGAGEFGRDAVAVAAEGHQRLRRHGACHGERRRERRRWWGAQRLGSGDGRDRGFAVGGGAQPGVAPGGAPRVEPPLDLLDGDVVGQGAPEALRGDVVGLLHHALAVAAPGRAGANLDAVVLSDRGEGGLHPAGVGVDHGGHPVEPPRVRAPAERAGDAVQAVDELRLIHRGAQPPAPPARVRQRPDQQVRGLAPPPAFGRVGQIDPVPLRLVAGRVLDHRYRAALRRSARLTRRAQAPLAQLPGQRRIRAVVAQLEQLVIQRAGPHVRVLGQPRGAVHRERFERIRGAAGTDTRLAVAGQMGADGLTVPAQMAGDRGDRPTSGAQGVRVDVFLPCEHGDVGLLRAGVWSETTSLEGAPPVSAEPRGWGI